MLHLLWDLELLYIWALGSEMPNVLVLVFYIVYPFFHDFDGLLLRLVGHVVERR